MAGFTQAYQQTLLDYAFPTTSGTDHVAYSTNGTSEFSGLARTAIGATGWSAATAATPSVKQNANALTSAAATAGGTVTHTAIFSAATGGTQKTDWQPLTTSRTIASGDQVAWVAGSIRVTLD
jgi:hypothetical protein